MLLVVFCATFVIGMAVVLGLGLCRVAALADRGVDLARDR